MDEIVKTVAAIQIEQASAKVLLADTRAGVSALEAGGLLGEGRALEIMDAPVEQHERPAQ